MHLKIDETKNTFLDAIGIPAGRERVMAAFIAKAITRAIRAGKVKADIGDVMIETVAQCNNIEEVAFACYTLHPMIKKGEEMAAKGFDVTFGNENGNQN